MSFEEDRLAARVDWTSLARPVVPRAAERAAPAPAEPRGQTVPSRDFLVAHASGRTGNDDIVEAFAKAGLVKEIIASLALLCDLPFEVVERLILREKPEIVLVLARAAGLAWRSASAILALRAGSQGIEPYELVEHLERFSRLRTATAIRCVNCYRVEASASKSPLWS
jgi:hypothetical protein